MKNCSTKNCQQQNPQPLSDFYKNHLRKDGLSSQCKSCKNNRQKIYHIENKTYISEKQRERYSKPENKQKKKERQEKPENKIRKKELHLKRLYGLSLKEHNEMLVRQNYKCKICKINEKDVGIKGLVVDHNHKTKQIRGLLCGPCNTAIGLLKEDIDIILRVLNYLKE
jgi:hypothetical protein